MLKLGTERPCFSFTGKPDLNVEIQDAENLLQFFKLFIMLEITELISRETNQYVQQFLEKKILF